jgi:hypothetical protein
MMTTMLMLMPWGGASLYTVHFFFKVFLYHYYQTVEFEGVIQVVHIAAPPTAGPCHASHPPHASPAHPESHSHTDAATDHVPCPEHTTAAPPPTTTAARAGSGPTRAKHAKGAPSPRGTR